MKNTIKINQLTIKKDFKKSIIKKYCLQKFYQNCAPTKLSLHLGSKTVGTVE
jgi:hypothetical protein